MQSGTYWEYLCIKCGFITEYIGFNATPEQGKLAKDRIEQRVKLHNEKLHPELINPLLP